MSNARDNTVITRELMDQVVALAYRAGDRILQVYNTEFNVDHKQDNSPLTAADLASHRCILAGLAALTPDIPVLSEESADIPYSERRQWSRYWLVDPLDGTKEFIKRNGEFTVNIALIDGPSPVMGVVVVPVSGKAYYAAQGIGAFCCEADGDEQLISVRGIRRDQRLTVVGSRSHLSERVSDYLQQMSARFSDYEMISMGSSLKFCLVAEGRADLYPRLGPTSEWDTAAAQAVVECAGGRVTTTDLRPLAYNSKESLLNPEFLVFADTGHDWSQYLP